MANDGFGTEALLVAGRGNYSIKSKPPEGVQVFSETHPVEYDWYNNRNPILAWKKEDGVTDFSYVLDNKPFTVPDDISDTTEAVKSYEKIMDGVWYFHIKVKKNNVWGETTHFTIKIDGTPPNHFIPTLNTLTATVIDRGLVSFSAEDNLSGIDHYEVGVIDKKKYPAESPAFVEASSPYQLSNFTPSNVAIIVRAFDKAGNSQDEVVNTDLFSFLGFTKNNLGTVSTLLALFTVLGLFVGHYVFGHHIIAILRRAMRVIREGLKNEENDKIEKPPNNLPT